MKKFIECLEQAAINEGWDNGQEFINWVHEEALNVFMMAAKIYTEQSNSHKHGVVRGGAIEAQSVPLEGEALKWTNSSVTQITPTEPLPAEGKAQNGRDGVMKWCDSCGKKTTWINGECENYKKQQSIEEAAEDYANSVEGTTKQWIKNAYIAGAKSQAAKEYWYEQFKQQKP